MGGQNYAPPLAWENSLIPQASFTRLVGTLSFVHPYKGTMIHLFIHSFFLLCSSIFAHSSSSAQVRISHLNLLQPCLEREAGGWYIKKLRKAGYLSNDIAHRLPDEGQLIPTPRPHERVVFLPHFLRGLGFPLHPFVRGLMFYYGLNFHDLAPNSILNISAFIAVCEAFLRIKPHFGLWLKTFNVKPKVVGGCQAECGGAMVGKMANVT